MIASDLLFERFYSNNGIPDNRIRSIFQDSKGFLWIGTMNGVSKYDGYSFENFYKTKSTNSISGNWVYDFCEDAAHNLWMATREGLNYFIRDKKKFINYKKIPLNPNSLFCNEINSLKLDHDNYLWIGTANGLAGFNPGGSKFDRYSQFPLNTKISKIINSYGDFIWIATEKGIVHFNIKTHHYKFYPLRVKSNPYGDIFWSMMEFHRDLYITTGGDGLVKLPFDFKKKDYGSFMYVNKFSNQASNLDRIQVFDICMSRNGIVWLGTGNGLAKIENLGTNSAKLMFYRNNALNNNSISNNTVYRIFVDRTDVLWCGTEMGLNKLDIKLLPFHYFTFTNSNFKDQVRCIGSPDGKELWLGTAQKGFSILNMRNGLNRCFRFNPEQSFFNSTRSILALPEGKIWLGTLGGLLEFSNGSFKKIIEGSAVFALYRDTRKNIWIGTNHGVYKLEGSGNKIHYLEGLNNLKNNDFVRSIFEDHAGNIWIGLENGGLYRLNPLTEKFSHVTGNGNGQLFGSNILCLNEYPDNVIWAGSESGLNKIIIRVDRNGKIGYDIKNYFESNGIPDKSINSIIPDYKGNLWISTIKGIVKFDIRREKFQKFLSNIDFSQSCFFKTNNSEFMFGASDGFVVFNPDEISTNQHFPAVTITDFRLFNRSVEIGAKLNGQVVLNQSANCTKELTLNYRNNVFTIEFAALDFSNPGENVFAYKLEGFDKNWIPTDAKNRNASYTNLNAGVYYFKVKASNNSGIWNDAPVVLKIRILPPPWKTWWAILIYILIFNFLLFVLFRYIMIQSKQRHQIELDKLEKEQLQNINQIKLQFFTNVSHEFRTPLSLIIGPVEDILSLHDVNESIRSKVEMIRHNCKKLFYLIDELMTFQKMDQGRLALKASYIDIVGFLKGIYQNFDILARRNNITMKFDTKLDDFKIWFNPNNIEKVINNLLSNAFKFTPSGGKISIEVSPYCSSSAVGQTPDFICISVVDNGKGISKQDMDHIFECFYQGNSNVKGTGVGLSLTKSLVELHKGFIRVSSDPLIETRFQVYLPTGDSHLSPEQKVLNDKNTGFNIENDASILVESSNQRDLLTANQSPDQNFDYDILVVDDNPELLDYLEMIFKDKYNVRRAMNGIEALDMIHNDEPDLVISDVMMPKMDGIELCKNIKNNLTSCHIPVILLTAKTAVEHRIEGIEVGADDYISKPFYPEFLKVRVEKLIESREKLIEKFRSDNVLIPKKVAKNPQDEVFVQKIIDIVMKNMSNEDFSVEELGLSVGMSRSNLFRKLKAITGQTPIEYIYWIRLKHSMDLLLERKLNVSEIAYEVGYKNPSSFSKSFRKQYGKAPSDFLNDILGKSQE